MPNYKIVHDRPGCIGCGSCAAVCPENWIMKPDGKSSPKKTAISEAEYKCNKDAADACPVNVIHIIEKESGKKII